MPNSTLLTDDFVAELLAKEASEASIKYSSVGLEAFRSTKPLNKAKPNTRFLNRIIKETTNHNHALRAKETAEAQARLDSLTEAEEKKRQRLNPTASDIRRRQLGTISSILHGGKRRDRDEPEKGKHGREESLSKHRQKVKVREGKDRDSSRRPRRKDDEEDEKSSSKHHRHHNRSSDRSRSPVQRERSRRKYRDRSPLSSDEDRRSHRTSESHGKKPEKDRGSHRRSGESSRHKRHSRSSDYDHSRSRHTRERHEDHPGDGDSDPLDDLIGPPPPPKSPVRVRGRGAMKGPAAMDKRFSEGYNAAFDTQLDVEEGTGTGGDWDEALELFRERQKWKQQGADRLRAAGFTEEQIKKWEKGGEKDIDDVHWAKRGEQREWDRGKQVDDSDFD